MTPSPQDDESYSLSKASDWPMLLLLGGMVITMIGVMWFDLKETIKDSRIEWRQELKEHKAEVDRRQEKLEKAIDDCRDGYYNRGTK